MKLLNVIATCLIILLLANFVNGQNNPDNSSTLTIYTPGLDGILFTGSTVQVFDNQSGILLATAILQNSYAQIPLVNSVDTEKRINDLSPLVLGAGNSVKIILDSEEITEVSVFDINGQCVFKDVSEKTGRFEIDFVKFSNAIYLIDITRGNKRYIEKVIKCGEFIRVGNSVNRKRANLVFTSSNQTEYRIVIKGAGHYTRTIRTTSTVVNDYLVEYLHQTGVTDSLFKEFCFEAAFRYPVVGLNTYFKKHNKKIVIVNKGYQAEPFTVSLSDMLYIKRLIETEIYPYIKTENRPPIELKSLNEFGYSEEDGQTYIFPHYGHYIGSIDFNRDGIIDNNAVYLYCLGYQDTIYTGAKLQEILSAFIGPGQVDGGTNARFANLTVLSSGSPSKKLTQMDKKLIRIGEEFPPMSNIDDILGLVGNN